MQTFTSYSNHSYIVQGTVLVRSILMSFKLPSYSTVQWGGVGWTALVLGLLSEYVV